MSETPDPPVPPDLDLSSLEYMPLMGARLLRSKSWLRAKRRPELGFYMMNLWIRAWSEKPAASLEYDDDVLADAAMCPPEKWDEYKKDALAGFVFCSDGRIYHSVLVEQAMIALEKRAKWKNKKAGQRGEKANYDERVPMLSNETSESVPLVSEGTSEGFAVTGRDGTLCNETYIRPPYSPPSSGGASKKLPLDFWPDSEGCEIANELLGDKWFDEVQKFMDNWHSLSDRPSNRRDDWQVVWRVHVREIAGKSPKIDRGPLPKLDDEKRWRSRISTYSKTRRTANWNGDWGPLPGEIGCQCPAHIQAEFGFKPTLEVANG